MTIGKADSIIGQAREQTISGMLRRTARCLPDKTAVICGKILKRNLRELHEEASTDQAVS